MIKKIVTLSVITFMSLYAKPTQTTGSLAKNITSNHQKSEKVKLGKGDIIFRSHEASGLNDIIKTAKARLGTRYVYGANRKNAVDCSSFTQQVFKKHNKKLPRTSRSQSSVGKRIAKKDLRKGDLVFFSSRNTRHVAHVGIYISKGNFIHASSGAHKVTISNLSNSYYRKHYKNARRV